MTERPSWLHRVFHDPGDDPLFYGALMVYGFAAVVLLVVAWVLLGARAAR
ncbi:MAG: hypothetical protein ACYCV4_18870 [Dermatophilaceae bacterium]